MRSRLKGTPPFNVVAEQSAMALKTLEKTIDEELKEAEAEVVVAVAEKIRQLAETAASLGMKEGVAPVGWNRWR